MPVPRGDSGLGCHHSQQRRTTCVPCTFVQFGLVLDQLDDLQSLERFPYEVGRVQLRQLALATGLVIELLGCVALENQHATRLQGADHVGELDEDRDHAIVALRCPVVLLAVGHGVVDRDPGFRRQQPRLGDACRGP